MAALIMSAYLGWIGLASAAFLTLEVSLALVVLAGLVLAAGASSETGVGVISISDIVKVKVNGDA